MNAAQSMNPPGENIAVVRRLYEARGNPEVLRWVLAPDVRWEVAEGFPHSDVYFGLAGVADFFTRLFSDFEDWHTEPSEFFEAGDRVIAMGKILGAREGDRQILRGAFCARLDDTRRRHRSAAAMR
jgi:uncharacterized protein